MGLVAGVLGFFGWLLLFGTARIVHHARQTHRASPRWVQNWPFHRLIFKSWYPLYLRCGGVLAWLLAACLMGVAVLGVAR
jgi:hypothetical protein